MEGDISFEDLARLDAAWRGRAELGLQKLEAQLRAYGRQGSRYLILRFEQRGEAGRLQVKYAATWLRRRHLHATVHFDRNTGGVQLHVRFPPQPGEKATMNPTRMGLVSASWEVKQDA